MLLYETLAVWKILEVLLPKIVAQVFLCILEQATAVTSYADILLNNIRTLIQSWTLQIVSLE